MRYTLLISTLLLMSSFSINASESAHVSRYLVVDSKVESEKLWPMETVISFSAKDHPNIKTAIESVLDHIGHRLHRSVLEQPIASLLQSPVPSIHSEFEQNSVKEIIHALVGPGFNIHVDPVYRLVAFEVNAEFSIGEKR